MFLEVILIVACAGSGMAQRPDDPLCVGKPCPRTQSCRVVADCTPTRDQCTLTAQCVGIIPYSHTSVCEIGAPIIAPNADGSYSDILCDSNLPCPNSTYCNTDLMDTYATCCRSAPAEASRDIIQCSPVMCAMYCPNGFVLNDLECPKCECKDEAVIA